MGYNKGAVASLRMLFKMLEEVLEGR